MPTEHTEPAKYGSNLQRVKVNYLVEKGGEVIEVITDKRTKTYLKVVVQTKDESIATIDKHGRTFWRSKSD